MTAGHNPTANRSKLGSKRHILTDKERWYSTICYYNICKYSQ